MDIYIYIALLVCTCCLQKKKQLKNDPKLRQPLTSVTNDLIEKVCRVIHLSLCNFFY